MKIGRRAFLGGMAAAPLAAPMAAQGLAASPAIVGGGGLLRSSLDHVNPAAQRIDGYIWETAGLSKQAWKLLEKSADEKQRLYDERVAYRLNGFDPDLYALHATSVAAKAIIQRQRDKAATAEIAALRLRMFPPMDDD